MSTLLEQASLIMIPSGYKEDVVYSVIPENGNGDLTFTRASDGTRINSAGLVEVVPWNLLQYSNAFNTAPWSMNVTSGQAGKDGQNNAWLLTKLGSSTSDFYNSNVYNGDQTFTIYVKKESGKGFKLYPIGTTTQFTEVNLQTGAVFFSSSGITSTTVEAYSSTWWKISVALNMINSNYYIYVTDGAGTQIASSITIQDAQVNIGLTAKSYFPTTDRLNVPRLTYQNGGGGCPSLLLEKQSTNLVTYSEQFDNVLWVKNSTNSTANTTTSPDGTQNADTITSISASPNIVSPLATFASSTNVSIFVKYVSQRWVQLMSGGAVNDYANFDIQNGVIGSVGSTTSNAQIENFGNGWYRISVNFSGYSGPTNLYFGFVASGTSGWNTFDPNFNKSVYAWGCQIEASSYPTSYIPTTSSSATRVADACYKTGISSLIGQTEGVIFVDAKNLYPSGTRSIGLLFTSGSAYYQIYINSSNQVRVDVNGTLLFLGGTIAQNTQYKIAFAYKSGSNVFYINGTQIATSASTTIPSSLADFYVGNSLSSEQSGSINQAILFPTRLTNTELASLTTI